MLKSRAKIVFALFVVVGVVDLVMPEPKYPEKTEDWMAQNLPKELPGYSYVSDIKMAQINYDQLKPFGIVSRQYRGPDGRAYEYLIIASNSKDSFHDQRICLTSQQYQLRDLTIADLNLPAFGGKVPATITSLIRSDSNGAAMIFYLGPYGLRPNPTAIPFDITRGKLLFKSDIHTVMFQFKVSPEGASLDDDVKALSAFANTMLNETKRMPEGSYFVAEK